MKKILGFMVLWGWAVVGSANTFWEDHAIGWHWYQDPAERSVTPAITNPVQTMEALQQQVKYSLDLAILNPTPANVQTYLTLQNQLSDKANRFAQIWQAVLLNDPSLNFSLQHPTNSLGKQIYLDQQHQAEDQAIRQLATHSGLFFFYRSSCPYCQRFAPIVKDFAQRYGISVVAITTAHQAVPEFMDSQFDQGQAAYFGVKSEPALFTVDPYSQQVIPVGYGLMSEIDLRGRILQIATLGK
ncbi:MAG: conjugal transfer protein TraF [Gammaproteobacteria bacterium]